MVTLEVLAATYLLERAPRQFLESQSGAVDAHLHRLRSAVLLGSWGANADMMDCALEMPRPEACLQSLAGFEAGGGGAVMQEGSEEEHHASSWACNS